MNLDDGIRRRLLTLARSSIAGAFRGEPPPEPPAGAPALLHELRASFVSLKTAAGLRGCIGTLEARRPLALDVVLNARAAAFEDPRFPPLTVPELPQLRIEISVLSAAEPLPAADRQRLLQSLHPGEDGLILQAGARRATFLPAVWATLADPQQFVAHLFLKAGLPPDYWSRHLRFFRYQAECFAEAPTDPLATAPEPGIVDARSC